MSDVASQPGDYVIKAFVGTALLEGTWWGTPRLRRLAVCLAVHNGQLWLVALPPDGPARRPTRLTSEVMPGRTQDRYYLTLSPRLSYESHAWIVEGCGLVLVSKLGGQNRYQLTLLRDQG